MFVAVPPFIEDYNQSFDRVAKAQQVAITREMIIDPLAAPMIEDRVTLARGRRVVPLSALVTMKLMSNRDLDRVHLRDMIGVGLIGRDLLEALPKDLAGRLEALLAEPRGEHQGG